MKTERLISALVAFGLSLGVGTAIAQETAKRPPAPIVYFDIAGPASAN